MSEPAQKLDNLGRCCGRKPLVYKREPHYFCTRRDRAYSLDTGEQIANWAWLPKDGGFVPRYPAHGYAQPQRRGS